MTYSAPTIADGRSETRKPARSATSAGVAHRPRGTPPREPKTGLPRLVARQVVAFGEPVAIWHGRKVFSLRWRWVSRCGETGQTVMCSFRITPSTKVKIMRRSTSPPGKFPERCVPTSHSSSAGWETEPTVVSTS